MVCSGVLVCSGISTNRKMPFQAWSYEYFSNAVTFGGQCGSKTAPGRMKDYKNKSLNWPEEYLKRFGMKHKQWEKKGGWLAVS